VIVTTALALLLAAPSPTAGPPAVRAKEYLSEGMRAYLREDYGRALERFEMAYRISRFAFGEDYLLRDALRMASTSALRVGNGKKAVELGKEYVKWAESTGDRYDLARGTIDLAEAFIILPNLDGARDALDRAGPAVEAAGDGDLELRLKLLREQIDGGSRSAAGTGAIARQAKPVVKRSVKTVDWNVEATADPAPAPREPVETVAPAPVSPTLETTSEPETAAEPVPRSVSRRVLYRAAEPTPVPATEAAAEPASRPVSSGNPPPTALTAQLDRDQPRSKAPIAAPGDDLVQIPAGTFVMGSNDGKGDQRPTREIAMHGFLIDRREVTNFEYRRFAHETGQAVGDRWQRFAGPEHDRQPVRAISWDDAGAYCDWVGKRLPTEAEWERAARGPNGWPYAFGASFSPGSAQVGLDRDAGPIDVESHAANPWGIHDMAGNVHEWCSDWYDTKAYRAPFVDAPGGPERGRGRTVRGGSWSSDGDGCSNATRMGVPPHRAAPTIGFRCARDR